MRERFNNAIYILLFFFTLQLGFINDKAMADHASFQFSGQPGQQIKPSPYKRIISLYGAHTENLFYLGLDKEIIGVANDDDYPPEVKSKPVFSAKDSIEKYLAANPDLVLMRPMHMSSYGRLVQRLEEHGITVIALQVNSFADLYDYWRLLGSLTGRQWEAEKMVAEFDEKIKKLSRNATKIKNKPNVFIEAFHRGTKTYIADSLPIWILTLAGGHNVADEVTSQSNSIVAPFGLERLLANQDKIDFYIIMNGPMNQTKPEELEKMHTYQRIKAVKDKKVFQMEEYLLARPTPRLALGLEKMIGIIHHSND